MNHPLKPTLYDNPILPYDYRNWVGNHVWVHKQPLPLWIMSASMWLFGVNEIALRLPSIILTTIGIWLSFIIGRYFFNKKNWLPNSIPFFHQWIDNRINCRKNCNRPHRHFLFILYRDSNCV